MVAPFGKGRCWCAWRHARGSLAVAHAYPGIAKVDEVARREEGFLHPLAVDGRAAARVEINEQHFIFGRDLDGGVGARNAFVVEKEVR